MFVFVQKASCAAHNLRARHRARRMRARLLHTPQTASRPARHGILRYGSGVRVDVRKGVDGAIPSAFSRPFRSRVSSCRLNVSSSSLFSPCFRRTRVKRRCARPCTGGSSHEREMLECNFRFSRMKSNPVWRCAQPDKSRHGQNRFIAKRDFFPSA